MPAWPPPIRGHPRHPDPRRREDSNIDPQVLERFAVVRPLSATEAILPRVLGVFLAPWASAIVGIVTAVVYFLLGTAWAFSSPVYSVPDEYSHAVKAAAVVRGDVRPTSETVGEFVTVPAWLKSASWACFAHHPEVTADCQAQLTGSTSNIVQITDAGRYPPSYYVLVGWPTLLFAGPAVFYAQREITVLWSAFFLGLAAWSASATTRNGRVLLSLGVAITPMTIFFMGGVNPQAPEIAAAASVWISGWALLQEPTIFNTGVIARLTISACALVLCRPLSVLWLAVIMTSLLVGFAQTSHWGALRRNLSAKICGGIVFVACLGQVLWVVSTGALTQSTHGVHMSSAEAVATSMSRQITWLVQMIGLFGWLDTVAWPPVYIVWVVAGISIVVAALCLGSRRERLALVSVMLASLFIPVVAELMTHDRTGFAWQGRYALPIAIGIILMSGMIAGNRCRWSLAEESRDRVARMVIVVLVGGSHFLAWASALKRYAVGALSEFPFGDYVIKWAPPGGVWIWGLVMGVSSGLFTSWLLWVTATSRPEGLSPGPHYRRPRVENFPLERTSDDDDQ